MPRLEEKHVAGLSCQFEHVPQVFNRWIDAKLAASPQPGLLVYPEGTRSQASASLALKRGMLRYAYSRRVPVQV
jgi:hypothetical protein